jgi:hypothetical protein
MDNIFKILISNDQIYLFILLNIDRNKKEY